MRYRIVFFAGVGTGFVLGARAGRERFDQLMGVVRRTMDNPTVHHAAGSVGEHAGHLAQSATHAAAEGGKNVAGRLGGTITGHLPPRLSEHLPGASGAHTRHPSRGGFFAHRAGRNGASASAADGYAFGGADEPEGPADTP